MATVINVEYVTLGDKPAWRIKKRELEKILSAAAKKQEDVFLYYHKVKEPYNTHASSVIDKINNFYYSNLHDIYIYPNSSSYPLQDTLSPDYIENLVEPVYGIYINSLRLLLDDGFNDHKTIQLNEVLVNIVRKNSLQGGKPKRTNLPYEKRGKSELQALCQKRKIKITSKMTKPELIALLRK